MNKAETIAFIGRLIRARKWCIDHRTGMVIGKADWLNVERPYNEYHRTWTITGLARYLVKYQHTLRLLATGGTKQVEALNCYILQAEDILIKNSRVNPVNQTGTERGENPATIPAPMINRHIRPAVNCDCRF